VVNNRLRPRSPLSGDDTERVVVASVPFLDHARRIHEATLTDGRTLPIGCGSPFHGRSSNCQNAPRQDRPDRGMLKMVPYGVRSGWL
jgi:hypothetical protein